MPVQSCNIEDKPTDMAAGTGCNGGTAYQCSNQQPWAINDTMSYGYAGVFITPDLTHGGIEGAWCCACYQLDFTEEPLKGKSMIVQASNTAYDITTTNRFSLAVSSFILRGTSYSKADFLQVPGGNTTSTNACAQQYGVDQSVFGEVMAGVSSKDDCKNLPTPLQAGCNWRFDWFGDASSPRYSFRFRNATIVLTSHSANFKRVVCPAEITSKTNCVRNDDRVLAGEVSSAPSLPPTAPIVAAAFAVLLGILSI